MAGQHMAVAAVTGEALASAAARGRAGAIYDLSEAPYLNAADGLAAIRLPDGNTAKLPRPPLRLDGRVLGLRCHPPAVGNAANALLKAVGLKGPRNFRSAGGRYRADPRA